MNCGRLHAVANNVCGCFGGELNSTAPDLGTRESSVTMVDASSKESPEQREEEASVVACLTHTLEQGTSRAEAPCWHVEV